MPRNNSIRFIIALIMAFSLVTQGTLYSFSFKSLSPFARAEETHAKTFGNNDASPCYREMAHEFLSYLALNNQDQVKVRKLEVSTDAIRMNFTFSSFVGIALWTGIWLDEAKLDKACREEQLWIIALVCAQYASNKSLSNAVLMQILPWGAGLANIACLLLGLPFIKACDNKLGKSLIIAMLGLMGTRLSIMLYSVFIQKWYSYYKQGERESTLLAAMLLCEHGYAAAFEKHLKSLEDHCKENAALNESRDQLAIFWNQWQKDHPGEK